MTREEIIERLTEDYPDRQLGRIVDIGYYQSIYRLAAESGMKAEEYLKSIGFTTMRERRMSDGDIAEWLGRYLPGGRYSMFKQIKKQDPELAAVIQKRAREKNMKPLDYLASIGFVKLTRGSDEDVKEELLKIYPDMAVPSMQDLLVRSDEIYRVINKARKDRSAREYLRAIGFTLHHVQTNSIDGQHWDTGTLNRLLDDYRVSASDISRMFNCSRELVRQNRNKSTNQNINGWTGRLTEEEADEVTDMIDSRHYSRIGNGTRDANILIASSSEHFEKKAVMIVRDRTVKVAFELPDAVEDAIVSSMMDIFTEAELALCDELAEIWTEQGERERSGEKLLTLEQNVKIRLTKYGKRHGLDAREYLSLLGYRYDNDHSGITDEEFRAIFEKHLEADGSNTVFLPSTDPYYHMLCSHASRRHMTIAEFTESFGYILSNNRVNPHSEQQLQNTIVEKYLANGKSVYISSHDPFYLRLRYSAKSKGLNITELLSSWGFRRITSERELPDGYVPYDFADDLLAYMQRRWSDEKLIPILEDISENGVATIPTSTTLYNIITNMAKANRMTNREYVESLGFIYATAQGGFEKGMRYIERETAASYTEELLEELEQTEASFIRITDKVSRIKRNTGLVRLLKRLYNGRCQICGNNQLIPGIEQNNGMLYSEVHHIDPMSAVTGEDDLEQIDSYRNTIVLCPHHHAWLHHHHGGGFRLSDDRRSLINDNGDAVEIVLDYHLAKARSGSPSDDRC